MPIFHRICFARFDNFAIIKLLSLIAQKALIWIHKSAVFEKNFSKKYPLHSFGQRVPKCTPKIAYLTEKFSKKIFLLLYLFESGTKKVRGFRRKNLQKNKSLFSQTRKRLSSFSILYPKRYILYFQANNIPDRVYSYNYFIDIAP